MEAEQQPDENSESKLYFSRHFRADEVPGRKRGQADPALRPQSGAPERLPATLTHRRIPPPRKPGREVSDCYVDQPCTCDLQPSPNRAPWRTGIPCRTEGRSGQSSPAIPKTVVAETAKPFSSFGLQKLSIKARGRMSRNLKKSQSKKKLCSSHRALLAEGMPAANHDEQRENRVLLLQHGMLTT